MKSTQPDRTTVARTRSRRAPAAGNTGWVVPAVLLMAALGCGDEPSAPAPTYAAPIQGCTQFAYQACDVTRPDCQSNVFGLVQCIRQTRGGSMVPTEVISAAEYRDRLTAATSDEQPVDWLGYETALVLLGLASSGDLTVSHQIDVLVETVPAYYSSEAKQITIVSPEAGTPEPLTPQGRTLVLAHEVVHALQDQQYDLTAFAPSDDTPYDQALARISVSEGEAQLYQSMLQTSFSGIRQQDAKYIEHFTHGAEYTLTRMASEAPYLVAPRVLPYYYGGRYAYLELQRNGRAGIDGLFANPPTAMAPYLLSEYGMVESPLSPVTNAAPTGPAGTTLVAEDTLGAWLAMKSQPATGPTVDPIGSIRGWRGDRLWVYLDAQTQDVAIVWRVRRESADDAAGFVAAVNYPGSTVAGVAGGQRQAFASGTDAFVVAVSGQLALGPWVAAATSSADAQAAPGGPSAPDTASAQSRNPRRLVSPEPRGLP
jgi:hypothetical protein